MARAVVVENKEIIKDYNFSEQDTIYNLLTPLPISEKQIKNFLRCLKKNLNYPKDLIKKHIEGIIYLEFVISKNGQFNDIKAIKSSRPELEEEAIRVVGSYNDFGPIYFEDKPITMRVQLPVQFNLY